MVFRSLKGCLFVWVFVFNIYRGMVFSIILKVVVWGKKGFKI